MKCHTSIHLSTNSRYYSCVLLYNFPFQTKEKWNIFIFMEKKKRRKRNLARKNRSWKRNKPKLFTYRSKINAVFLRDSLLCHWPHFGFLLFLDLENVRFLNKNCQCSCHILSVILWSWFSTTLSTNSNY